jgi:hypothetical protein
MQGQTGFAQTSGNTHRRRISNGNQTAIVRRRQSTVFDFFLMRLRIKSEHALRKGVLATFRQARSQ